MFYIRLVPISRTTSLPSWTELLCSSVSLLPTTTATICLSCMVAVYRRTEHSYHSHARHAVCTPVKAGIYQYALLETIKLQHLV